MPLFRNILISLFIAGILLGILSLPAKESRAAAIMGDPWQFLKEFTIKPLVRKIANSLENKLVNQINKQISNINGRMPAFITNWRNHLLDSQGRGNDVFRAVLADTQICGFMKDNIRQAFGADLYGGVLQSARVTDGSGRLAYENKTNIPGMASFQSLGNCTLPSNFNVNNFNSDFTQGGWEAWDRLLEPQNNLFGVYSMALSEQERQIQTEKESSSDSSVAGQGFLSQKLGVGDSGLGPTGCTSSATGPNRCVFFGKIVTPEQVIGKSAANAIDAKIKRPGAAMELTDVILGLFSAIVEGTTNRISNYIGQATYGGGINQNDAYNENQFDKGAGDPDFDNQTQQINNQLQQRDNQIQQQVDDANTKIDNLDNDNTCIDTCLADGNDQATCDSRCNPTSTPPIAP